MNASLDLGGVWQLAGWTMLHFLWIGALVALAGGALRLACRRAAPGVRYAVSLVTLAAIAATPMAITAWLAPLAQRGPVDVRAEASRRLPTSSSLADAPIRSAPTVAAQQVIDLAKTPIVATPITNGPEPHRAVNVQPLPPNIVSPPIAPRESRDLLNAAAGYLPWVWLVGAPITFVLLAAGLVGSKRMRRTSTPLDSGPVAEACERLRELMRISRRVIVAVSDAVAQPVLVGIVRPTILLPAAALSGWSPEELEMVLVHELAHVRRWDNLVNLMQRLVESLLFFHPAVWLASRQVRRDREECCDAAVVRHTARPEAYASLLVRIAAWRRRTGSAQAGLALASAMADHPLAGRIRRILNLEDESMRVSRSTLGVALVSMAALIGAALFIPRSDAAPTVEKSKLAKQNVDDKKLVPTPDDLAHLGETPAALADLRALFVEDVDNPLETRTYSTEKLPRRLDMRLDDQLEIMQSDPFGPKLDFKFENIDGGKEYRITAPIQAQRKYFTLIFSGRLAELSRVAAANLAANPAPATATAAATPGATSIPGIETSQPGRPVPGSPQPQAQVAEAPVPGPPIASVPGKMVISLPEQVRNSEEEVKRTFKLLEVQGFQPKVTTLKVDGASQKVVSLITPDGGVWKPVWETRMDRDRPITVVRMVREEVQYHDPAAPSPSMTMVAPGVIQASPGPVPVVRPYQPGVPSALPAGRKLQPGDQVSLDVVGAFPDRPLTNVYRIEPEGTLALGASYGRVPVAGHTVLEAEDLIKSQLSKVLSDVEVQLVLKEPAVQDVLIPSVPATAPYPSAPSSGWNGNATWNSAPTIAAQPPLQPAQQESNSYAHSPIGGPRTISDSAPSTPAVTKQDTKQAEIDQKLRTPVKADFVEIPLAEAVSLLSVTAKVNMYIDPRGIDDEALSVDVPVSLVLPNEISVKSALKLVLDPLGWTYVIEDEVVKITSEKRASKAAAASSVGAGNDNQRYFYYDNSKETKPTNNAPAVAPQPSAQPATSTAPATEGSPASTTSFGPPADRPRSESVERDAPAQGGGAPSTTPEVDPKASYLYDGMTFDQWRSMWQEELKTEKRTEAIEALAAFGRAGYGREAIQAIFDVAGQYDFLVIDDSAEGKLKNRVIELLTTTSFSRLSEAEWLPLLEERLKADPKRYRWLAAHLFSRLRTDNPQVLDRLYELATSGEKQLRNDVLVGLMNSDGERQDERLLKLADELLASADAADVKRGVSVLTYYPGLGGLGVGGFGGGRGGPSPKLRFRPGLMNAAFHADEGVRRVVRQALVYIDKQDAPPVVEQLMARLKKSEEKDERLAALRAIAALGPKASGATESAMAALIDDYNDLELAAAAAVAQDRIVDRNDHSPGKDRYKQRLHKLIAAAPASERHDLYNDQAYDREVLSIFPSDREQEYPLNAGNGGGFF